MRRVESPSDLELGEQEKCIAILLEGQTEASAECDPPESEPYWAFVITPSGGVIRGVHDGEDDRQPNAPLAADLLNPDSVKRFIELTHERYYNELKEFFGTTIQAFFTDEPSIMGRGAKRGLKKWTDGLEEQFRQLNGYDLIPLLPALGPNLIAVYSRTGGTPSRSYDRTSCTAKLSMSVDDNRWRRSP